MLIKATIDSKGFTAIPAKPGFADRGNVDKVDKWI
jgi:hypothetical protein